MDFCMILFYYALAFRHNFDGMNSFNFTALEHQQSPQGMEEGLKNFAQISTSRGTPPSFEYVFT